MLISWRLKMHYNAWKGFSPPNPEEPQLATCDLQFAYLPLLLPGVGAAKVIHVAAPSGLRP